MRKIGLLLIAVMMILPAMAQVSFGVRAGGAYSSLIQKVEDTYEAGARFGFSIAGGAYYSNQDIHGMALHNKCWYYSLQIPVNVAYTFTFTDVHLSVFAGPTFDWSLFGKMKSRETNPDLHFGVSDEKDLKPCDFGMNVGLSVEYSNFFFSVSSLCGMIDRRALKRDGETSVYQNNVTFSLGYYFRK